MTSKAPRPPAVTSACLFVGLSSALLLYYVVSWLTSWNSLDMQEVRSDLAGELGVSAGQVGSVLRPVLVVLVAVLVSGAVGAIYAARGDRPSRVLVTGVAGTTALVFLTTGGVLGLLPGAFAVAAIVQLWGRDARRWFAVVNGREVPPEPVRPAAQHPAVQHPAAQPPAGQPPAGQHPAGQPPAAPPDPQVWPQQWAQHPQQPWRPPVDPRRAPQPVRTLLLVTIIASAAALGTSALYLLIYGFVPHDELVRSQLESPFAGMVDITETEVRQALRTTAVMSGIGVVLSAAALVAAWAVHRRHPAGPTALFVLSVVTIILGALTIVGIPWAAGAIWVLVLLRRPDVRRWMADRPARQP